MSAKFNAFKQKAFQAVIMGITAMMVAIPTFAASSAPEVPVATIDPTAFDPLVSGVVSNIGAVFPRIIPLAALVLGLSFVFSLIKKFTRTS